MVTFTINISQMLPYMAYMDPMGLGIPKKNGPGIFLGRKFDEFPESDQMSWVPVTVDTGQTWDGVVQY